VRKQVEEKVKGINKANSNEYIANPNYSIKSADRPRKKTRDINRTKMTNEDYLNAIPEVGGLP
jgi:hypothetical protein